MTDTLPAGWLSEAEADQLAQLATGRTVLELGAWKGRSTVAMASTAAMVVSVDRHAPYEVHGERVDEDSLPDYLVAVRGLANIVAVLGEFTVARMFSPDAFDLVFVDGFHDRDNVLHDLALARRFTEATIACHDFGRWDTDAACLDTFGRLPDRVVDSLAVYLP